MLQKYPDGSYGNRIRHQPTTAARRTLPSIGTYLYTLLVSLSLLGSISLALAQSPTIIGPSALCVDENGYFFVNLPNVISYEWSASGPATYGLTDSSYFNVKWSGPGSYTVSLLVWTTSGQALYTKPVTVSEAEDPIIFTSFDSDCGKVIDAGGEGYFLEPSACFVGCAGSAVMYWVDVETTTTVTWNVPNGVPYTFYGTTSAINGDTILVEWENAGSYVLSVMVEPRYGCEGYAEMCVEIIDSPEASFTTTPVPSGDTINLCRNQTLFATSTSGPGDGPPLMNWLWDFGDGFTGNGEIVSHQYTLPGIYTLRHIVENECHCADTAEVTVVVSSSLAVDIECPGIVCPGDTVIYYTSATCSPYSWTVTGGTYSTAVNQDNVYDSIAVVWGNPANGLGKIALNSSSCSGSCSVPAVVYIPVLVDDMVITGPDTACPYQTHTYRLPHLPGTTIQWQIPQGSFGVFTGNNTGNEVEVYWTTVGNQTLEVSYQNDFIGCSGTSEKNVTVLEELSILNIKEQYCYYDNLDVSASPSGGSYSWEVLDQSGQVVLQTNGSGMFYTIGNAPFTAGSYRLRLYDMGGDFCQPWVEEQFEIEAPPEKPAVIEGPRQICPGELGVYTATPTSADYYLEWEVFGGSPGSATGNSVAVRWNQTGPWKISVRQVQRWDPECEGDTLLLTVTQWPSAQPTILGADSSCINSVEAYTTDVAGASLYEWSITTEEKGSVASGQGERDINIQWNNTPGNATITLKTTVCGSSQTNTKQVYLKTQTSTSIACSTYMCQGDDYSFESTTEGYEYIWDFGDGTNATVYDPVTSHKFLTDGTYSVSLKVVNPDGCTDTAKASKIVYVRPGPVAVLSTPDDTISCTTLNAMLYVSIQTPTSGTYTYAWYKNGSLIAGQTSNSLSVTTPGKYKCEVTEPITGCSAFTNAIRFKEGNCVGDCQIDGTADFTYTTYDHCGKVFVEEQLSAKGRVISWQVVDPAGSNPTFTGDTFTYFFTSSGYHRVMLWSRFPELGGGIGDSCDTLIVKSVEVPLFADFLVEFACGSGNTFEATFLDQSDYVNSNVIDSWKWYLDGVEQTAHNDEREFTLSLNAGQSYEVKLWIKSNVTGASCEITKTIEVPEKPQAAFSAPDNSCTGVPTVFINQSTGDIIESLWDFGDGASLRKFHGVREYVNAFTWPVKLVVTDVYGCKDSITSQIVIHNDLIGGEIIATPDSTLCYGDEATLYFDPEDMFLDTTDFTYLWLHNASTYASTAVDQSGYYFLYAYNENGCRKKFRSPGMVFQRPPQPIMAGRSIYCEGEPMEFTANAGSQYAYQWLLNGWPIAPNGDGPTYSNVGLPPGNYALQVILTDPATGCTDTSGVLEVEVHGLPAVPNIVSSLNPACGPALQNLTVTTPDVPYYQWNTGQVGKTVPVFEPDIYAVHAFNQYGCSRTGFFELPGAFGFDDLLTGCYEKCDTAFPTTIPGIPGDYGLSWYWYRDGYVIQSGQTNIPPLNIPGAGAYRMVVSLNGCTDTSDYLFITELPCGDSSAVACDQLSVSLQSIGCNQSYGEDSTTYTVHLNIHHSGSADTDGFEIINTSSNEGDPALLTGSGIGAGNNTVTYKFTDLSPLDEEVCFEITLVSVDSQLQDLDTCILEICFTLPVCDTVGSCTCCLLDLDLTNACIGKLSGTDKDQFVFDLQVVNPTSHTFLLHLNTPSGDLSNVKVDPIMARPDTTLVSGVFTNNASLNEILCVEVWAVDSATSQMMLCIVCDSLADCPPPDTCTIEDLSVNVKTVGLTDSGANVVYFDIGFNSSAEGTLFIESGDGDIIQYAPSYLHQGHVGTDGFLITENRDSACIDLIIVDTASGASCRYTICFEVPPCERLVPDCSDEWGPAIDLVLCDSINLPGLETHSFYWRVALDSGFAGTWEVWVSASSGSLSNVSPEPVSENHKFVGGYGFNVPFQEDPYCLDFVLVDPVTMEVCQFHVCTSLPCKEMADN